jgi:hypothetical protein
MAAPFGDTMVQTALHFASSKGAPFSAACTLATPIRMVVHVKIASLIARTPKLTSEKPHPLPTMLRQYRDDEAVTIKAEVFGA